jgi:hypothetical protein
LPDGGVEQHPIHDEDLEDLGPEDYEALADTAETRFREYADEERPEEEAEEEDTEEEDTEAEAEDEEIERSR